MSDEAQDVSLDDLPRFAATKELIVRYGDDWTTWAFFGAGALLLTLLALAFAEATGAPTMDVLPAILLYGGWTFIAGTFIGTLWSGLLDDAKEREAMKRVG